jgi:hypothetical protein
MLNCIFEGVGDPVFWLPGLVVDAEEVIVSPKVDVPKGGGLPPDDSHPPGGLVDD